MLCCYWFFMFHVIVVVGLVRLVACSCGSCNIVKIMGWGLDMGLQLWDQTYHY